MRRAHQLLVDGQPASVCLFSLVVVAQPVAGMREIHQARRGVAVLRSQLLLADGQRLPIERRCLVVAGHRIVEHREIVESPGGLCVVRPMCEPRGVNSGFCQGNSIGVLAEGVEFFNLEPRAHAMHSMPQLPRKGCHPLSKREQRYMLTCWEYTQKGNGNIPKREKN